MYVSKEIKSRMILMIMVMVIFIIMMTINVIKCSLGVSVIMILDVLWMSF